MDVANDDQVALRGRQLSPASVDRMLSSLGLEVAPSTYADDVDGIAEAYAQLAADRVVLKCAGLLHKTDRGGVVTGLATLADVVAAARHLDDEIGVDGHPFMLQRQTDGFEALVGLRTYPGIGTVVLVGEGGVATEIRADTARRLAPVTGDEALAMIRELRVSRLLEGFRRSEPRDVAALAEIVARISHLAARTDTETILELDLNPVMVGSVGSGAVVVDARVIVADGIDEDVRPIGRVRDLTRALSPKHVAVVGVSDDESKPGARIFRYLVDHGFEGRIDPVHPSGGTIGGVPRATSLAEIEPAPDLVSVAVPARVAVEVVREAVAMGVGGVIVHSADFAESGADGAKLQAELRDIVRDADVPLIGPNSMGIVVPGQRLVASISHGLGIPELGAGGIALLASSGALGSCVATRLMEEGTGFAHWIDVGNEADLTVADYLLELSHDPAVRTAGLLLEDVKDGPGLVEAGRAMAAAGKPVFAYGLARSTQGQHAALSHTGSMVGPFAVREEVLRAARIVSVPTLRVFEDAMQLAANEGLPRGDRLAVVAFSGGACTIIADELADEGFELPALPDSVRAEIERLAPAMAAVRNPMDLSFEMVGNAEEFGRILRVLTEDAFDALLIQFTTNADPQAEHLANSVVEVRASAGVPVYVSRFGGNQIAPRAMQVYRDAGVPLLDAPDRSARAVAALVHARAAIG